MKYNSEIKTAVVPAGGYGTRFMPATKSIPKEMFPMGSKPVILHVVEEIVQAGIEQIIFIVSHHKQSIESFFSPNQILEDFFTEQGKTEQVEQLRRISQMADFGFVYTKPPYGNGGALIAAEHLLRKKHPFLFVWSDELMLTKGESRVKQCVDAYQQYGKPVVSAIEIQDPEKRSRYGMAELKDLPGDETVKEIVRIAEKPALGQEPSPYATHGAYILHPDEIFESLKNTPIGKDGELWLTDALNNMMPKTGLLAKIIKDATYLDCGNPLEYLKSQIDYTLGFSEDAADLKRFLKEKGL
ncbi:UTP--glucose-1-phosphate uridylyltransferase [Patescibacteria group bacterium]|nr:MAG: UTP--glucose-1-phosphate uridylyltransferase [Patescibacteria group bacterium]